MSKLVEDFAKRLYHDWHETACDFAKEKEATRMSFECVAQDYIKFISQHPETLERRRRDFEAGMYCEPVDFTIHDPFNDYLAAEKGEK